MTLKLRTHEEIHHEIIHPKNLDFFKRGLTLLSIGGEAREKARHVGELNRRLLIAAGGTAVLRGRNGRVLEALAEMGPQPRGVTDLRTAGGMAREVGTHLKAAVLSLDLRRLGGLSSREKELLSHHLESAATYLQERGKFLEKNNEWRSG